MCGLYSYIWPILFFVAYNPVKLLYNGEEAYLFIFFGKLRVSHNSRMNFCVYLLMTIAQPWIPILSPR